MSYNNIWNSINSNEDEFYAREAEEELKPHFLESLYKTILKDNNV